MTIIDRIKEIIRHYKLSVRSFEKTIDASNGTIQQAIKRGSDIKLGTLNKILQVYKNVNPEWLFMGKGEMLRKKNMLDSDSPSMVKEDHYVYGKHSHTKEYNKLAEELMDRDKLVITSLQKQISLLEYKINYLEEKLKRYEG